VTQWSRPRDVLSEIMRGSQVRLRDAVPVDSPGHGHTRNNGLWVIRGNGQLSLITGLHASANLTRRLSSSLVERFSCRPLGAVEVAV
jgi:hypothetical protein